MDSEEVNHVPLFRKPLTNLEAKPKAICDATHVSNYLENERSRTRAVLGVQLLIVTRLIKRPQRHRHFIHNITHV